MLWVVTRLVAVGCLVLSALAVQSDRARAQGFVRDGELVSASGLCLDVEGAFTSATPPPAGTPVRVSACDGSEDQRWHVEFGDPGAILWGVGRRWLVRRGADVVVSVERVEPFVFFDGSHLLLSSGITCLSAPSEGGRAHAGACANGTDPLFTLR